eukprot:s103_g59.t1
MNEAEQKQFVADRMDSDLQFVLADSGVSLAGQVAIARHYGNMRKFRAVGDTRAEVRRACLADFAIPQDTPAETASIVSAWEVAQEYISKEVEIRAEAKGWVGGTRISHVGGLKFGHAMRRSALQRGPVAVKQHIVLGPKPVQPTFFWCGFAVAIAFFTGSVVTFLWLVWSANSEDL